MKTTFKSMVTRLLGFSLSLVLFFNCDSPKQAETLGNWEPEIQKKEEKACVGESCARVSVSYPVFADDNLQSLVFDWLAQGMSFEQQPANFPLDSAIRDFLDAFTSLKAEFPDANGWEYSSDARVSFQGDTLLSLAFDSFSYTGGAHPNSSRSYLNFNKVTGKAIPNSDLIRNKEAILVVAEQAFRRYHRVEGQKSLKDDGRFFLNEKEEFFLPAAMGFEQGHFVLYYNSYEIGPYVLGPTEIKIPFVEIQGMLNFTAEVQ